MKNRKDKKHEDFEGWHFYNLQKNTKFNWMKTFLKYLSMKILQKKYDCA